MTEINHNLEGSIQKPEIQIVENFLLEAGKSVEGLSIAKADVQTPPILMTFLKCTRKRILNY